MNLYIYPKNCSIMAYYYLPDLFRLDLKALELEIYTEINFRLH